MADARTWLWKRRAYIGSRSGTSLMMGIALILANAMHVKAVPRRKGDVNDATWLADLLAHGLIRASFVPPTPIEELRDLTRTRKQLTREIVTCRAGYGSSAPFRQALTDRKLAWAVGILRHLKVYAVGVKRSGRLPGAAISVDDMLVHAKWHTISWRTGPKFGLQSSVARIAENGFATSGGLSKSAEVVLTPCRASPHNNFAFALDDSRCLELVKSARESL